MYWYGCPSQLFPVGYKNTPFPKQYTILSNKWGAVQSRWAFSYLYRIIGSCFILQPTFLHSSANIISGVRSKKPMSRFQLVPHLQRNSPVNCCFILRPQFGQICLLAPILHYWSFARISSAVIPLASSFFSTSCASPFFASSAAFASAAAFLFWLWQVPWWRLSILLSWLSAASSDHRDLQST